MSFNLAKIFKKSNKQSGKKKQKLKKNKKNIFGAFFNFFLVACIWGSILFTLVIVWFVQDLPSLHDLGKSSRNPNITIQSQDGTTLAVYGDSFEQSVKIQDLPDYVPKALMAVEDRRFYYHFGVDFIGLFRAFYANYKAGRVVQGGSTLTQQLAKNLLFAQGEFDNSDRSIKRKILEFILAIWLEWKFNKSQILTMYINRVYLGGGTFGIEAAAQKHFNKSATDLSIFEAALLAGLLKAPSRYSPSANIESAKARAKVVLNLMQEAGFINDAKEQYEKGTLIFKQNLSTQDVSYKYFCDWIIDNLDDYISTYDQDLIIVTTLDPKVHKAANSTCLEMLETDGKKMNTSQMAFVAMSPNGAIKAMVGGASYKSSQFNRVLAQRQPGSIFKMFIYLTALENGFTPDDMVDDSPVVIGNWKPSNYTYKSKGQISIKDAFARSINCISIRLAQYVGPKKIIQTAHKLGITSNMQEHISISLGSIETNLLDLTASFATFANKGRAVWPYGILEIRNKDGKILYKKKNKATKTIIKPDVLANMRLLLRGVMARGSGARGNLSSTIMGKTGSNGDKDAWFIGIREYDEHEKGIQNMIIGVWTGNDNNKAMNKKSTGSNIPLSTAIKFYKTDINQEINTQNSITQTDKLIISNKANAIEEVDDLDAIIDDF